uniref:Centrosomal protein 78 n=1 Tax=Hippocampus comes TaxID=109280 RepID=A0A3Q2XII0_HIPCM
MIGESVQIKRRGAHDFMEYYTYACTREQTIPLTAVKMHLDQGILDFNGDKVKLSDWPPILDSISINRHLHHIAITSTYQTSHGCGDPGQPVFRKKIPSIRSKDMTFKLCKALKECLSLSPNLKTLKLNGLPLRERDLVSLTKGVAKSVSLEALSLANCPFGDDGLEVICQSVKYSTRIKELDFTGCNITWRGAEHLANIIQHQGIQRHGSAWSQSLRYQQPKLEGMGGLRRLTLNCNTLIGDLGAARLARELAEDLWLKAVDLQKCGLSNRGACHLLEVLKTNSTLCVLDIRNNPLVGKNLSQVVTLFSLSHTVCLNCSTLYIAFFFFFWKHCTTFTVTILVHVLEISTWGKIGHLMATTRTASFQGRSIVCRLATSSSRLTARMFFFLMSFVVPVLQMALQECRLRLGEERRARLKAESLLREFELENARLRDNNNSLSKALAAMGSAPTDRSALEDEDVLVSIERSFAKFHAFLDLVNDAGLGQLASVAGIDTSDFSPLGRPQLSSTLGHVAHLDGAASGGRRSHDIQVENCVVVSIWKASCHAYFLKLSLINETDPNTHESIWKRKIMKWSLATNSENALKFSFATRHHLNCKFTTNSKNFIM